MITQQAPLPVSAAALTTAVRRALRDPAAALADWTATPLAHRVINQVTGGLWRVSGSALVAGTPVAWSLVLKLLRLATDAASDFTPSTTPGHWNYWRREALAYTTGLLDDLPVGLVAPRCLLVTEPATDEVWLWLEDIAGRSAMEWPIARFELAARQFGQFQGMYAVGHQPLPEETWLSRDWLRAWVPDEAGVALDLVHDPAAWRHPLLRDLLPADAATTVAWLWQERDALIARVERAPRTLCHFDLWPRNLFSRSNAQTGDETVLLDWSQVGIGGLAEDCANLVCDSVWMQTVDGQALPAFERAILAGYQAGLRSAGWTRDWQEVYAVYATVAALRFGLLAGRVLAAARDERGYAELERRYQRPAQAIVSDRALVVAHALALALELRGEGAPHTHAMTTKFE
jgi:hypothetical protein